MSNLAFCAAPIENNGNNSSVANIKQNKRNRNRNLLRRRRNNTMKQYNSNRNPKNVIDEIHQSLSKNLGESSNLSDFHPPAFPKIDFDVDDEHDPNKSMKRPRTPTRETMKRTGSPGSTYGGPIASSHYPDLEYGEPEVYLEEVNDTPSALHNVDYYSVDNQSSKKNTKKEPCNEPLDPSHPQLQKLNADREELMRKLNYMIQLLEENHDEKTGHVTEEVLLYSFLGIFIIFVVDSFAKAGKYIR